jgi:hypothetical protein
VGFNSSRGQAFPAKPFSRTFGHLAPEKDQISRVRLNAISLYDGFIHGLHTQETPELRESNI